jgi:hypothetical protein
MRLTTEKKNGLMEKNTPAKEVGITKDRWTLTKLDRVLELLKTVSIRIFFYFSQMTSKYSLFQN